MREDFPYLGPQPYGHASSPELWNGASRKEVMRGSASSDWEAPHGLVPDRGQERCRYFDWRAGRYIWQRSPGGRTVSVSWRRRYLWPCRWYAAGAFICLITPLQGDGIYGCAIPGKLPARSRDLVSGADLALGAGRLGVTILRKSVWPARDLFTTPASVAWRRHLFWSR